MGEMAGCSQKAARGCPDAENDVYGGGDDLYVRVRGAGGRGGGRE